MLKLNILSQELKKEIKLLIVYKFLKRLSFLMFSLLLIYTVTFQVSKYILQKYSDESANNKAVINKNSEEYIKKVKDINEQILNVSTVQTDFVDWSDFIVPLSEKINSSITLNQLTIDKKNGTLIISGIADTRDSLLGLKSSLEELKYLSEINLPISTLLKKELITFTISAKFVNYEI